MRTSQLQQQLAKLRERPENFTFKKGVYRKTKDSKGLIIDSLLYEPKEAALYDVETLRRQAIEAFDTLVLKKGSTLLQFSQLFDPQRNEDFYLRKKRAFLTQFENYQLNLLINKFLKCVASYWQETQVLQCLEYMIRHFKINKFNVHSLILMALPYHDTQLFVRLVQIVDLTQLPVMTFLKKIASSQMPLKRSVFTDNCIRNPLVLSFLSHALIESFTHKESPSITLISFFTLCTLEIIGNPSFQPSEQFFRQFLPCVFFALEHPLHQEFHTSALLVLSCLSKRVALSREACDAAMTETFVPIFNEIQTVSIRRLVLSKSFTFLNVLLIEQTSSKEKVNVGVSTLPTIVTRLLVNPSYKDDIIDAIKSICDDTLDITPLIGVLFRSLFYEFKAAECKEFKEQLSIFSSELLSNPTITRNSATRVCIFLAVFEFLIADSTNTNKSIVKKVLDRLEKMYPTCVTLAFNYFISTRPNADVTKKLLRALCDIFVDDDMLSMTFNDACGIENGFNIRYALTNENVQMRKEAVLTGLKYFNETIENTSTLMNNLFLKLLLDRSTDSNISIAKSVFNEKKLWLTCSLQDTLSHLFYQIYFLLGQSTKGSLPWMVNIPESLKSCKESVTSVLVHLISQNIEVQERLSMVLDCLSLIIEHYSSKIFCDRILTQVAPIFLPLCWCFAQESFDTPLSKSVAKVVEKLAYYLGSNETSNESKVINQNYLSDLLLTYDHDIVTHVVQYNKNNDIQNNETTIFHIQKISVCSLNDTLPNVPIVLPWSPHFLGGAWHCFAWLEALAYRMKTRFVSSYDSHKISLALDLCWMIFLYSKKHTTSLAETRVYHTLSQFIITSIPFVTNQAELQSFIVLCLLGLFKKKEVVLQGLKNPYVLPVIGNILAEDNCIKEMTGHILGDELICFARCNAAQMIQHVLCGEPIENRETLPFYYLFLGILGGVFNCDDPVVQSEALAALRAFKKSLQKNHAWTTEVYHSCTSYVNVINASGYFTNFQQVSCDVILLLDVLVSHVETKNKRFDSLQQFICQHSSTARLLILMALLCPISSLCDILCQLVNDVSVGNFFDILLPVWYFALCHSNEMNESHLSSSLLKITHLMESKELEESDGLSLMEHVLEPFILKHKAYETNTTLFMFLTKLVCSTCQQSSLGQSKTNKLLLFAAEHYALKDVTNLQTFQNMLKQTFKKPFLLQFLLTTKWDPFNKIHLQFVTIACETLSFNTKDNLTSDNIVYTNDLFAVLQLWMDKFDQIQTIDSHHSALLSTLLRCLTRAIEFNYELEKMTKSRTDGSMSLFQQEMKLMTLYHVFLFPKNHNSRVFLTSEDKAKLCLDIIHLVYVTILYGSHFHITVDDLSQLVSNVCENFLRPLFQNTSSIINTPSFKCGLRNLFQAIAHLPATQSAHISLIVLQSTTQIISSQGWKQCMNVVSEGGKNNQTIATSEELIVIYKAFFETDLPLTMKTACISYCLFFIISLHESLLKQSKTLSQITSEDQSVINIDEATKDISYDTSSSKAFSLWMDTLLKFLIKMFSFCELHLISSCLSLLCGDTTFGISLNAFILNNTTLQLFCFYTIKIVTEVNDTFLQFPGYVDKLSNQHMQSLLTLIMQTWDFSNDDCLDDTLLANASFLSSDDSHKPMMIAYGLRFIASCWVMLRSIYDLYKNKIPSSTAKNLEGACDKMMMTFQCPVVNVLFILLVTNQYVQGTKQQPSEFHAFFNKNNNCWEKQLPSFLAWFCKVCYKEQLVMMENHWKQNEPHDSMKYLTKRQGMIIQRNPEILSTTICQLLKPETCVKECQNILGCLLLTFGSLTPVTFVEYLMPYFIDILRERKKAFYKKKVCDSFKFVFYCFFHSLPKEYMLKDLKELMTSLLDFWNKLHIGQDLSSKKIIHTLHWFCIICSSPITDYLTYDLEKIVSCVLFHPNILQHIYPVFACNDTTFNEYLAMLFEEKTPCVQWNPFQSLLSSVSQKKKCFQLNSLWKTLTLYLLKAKQCKLLFHSLEGYITKDSKCISTVSSTNITTLRCSLSFLFLAKIITSTQHSFVTSVYSTLTKICITSFHACIEYIHTFHTVPLTLSNMLQSQYKYLLPIVYPRTETSHVITLLKNSSQLQHDPTNVSCYALIEPSLLMFIKAWLPKLTDAQLQPLIVSLVKYSCHGESTFMQQTIETQQEGTSLNTSLASISRKVASAKLFFNIYSLIVSELGDIGILSTLCDIVPHLQTTLSQCQKNFFTTAMTQQCTKKRKSVSTPYVTQTLWWFDLGLPTLLCLGNVAKVSACAPFVSMFLPLLIDCLDVFTLLPRPLIIFQDTILSFNVTQDSLQQLSHLWLAALMNSSQYLFGHILQDTLKVRSLVQPLLVKAQKSKDSAVRFTCLVLLYHLWFSHGPSFLSTLSDSLQVFTELLDDYDHDVEHVTSYIVKLIEKLTGETLQSRLGM